MFDDCNITLLNTYVDKDTKLTKYKITHLRGVDWQNKTGINIYQTRGMVNGDDIKIFIPFDADTKGIKYMKPKAFKQLSDLEKEKYYTFNTSDKVIKGIIDFEINSDNIKKIDTTYDDVVTIRNIATCDMMGHFELECE